MMRSQIRLGQLILNAPKMALIAVVLFYQVVFSPIKFAIFGQASRCRFEPSCSQYALEAVRRHGFLRGTWLAMKRLLRCHPWGAFGPDPVPSPRQAAPRTCC
jgi:putative membrane protein insertion efficiency factor